MFFSMAHRPGNCTISMYRLTASIRYLHITGCPPQAQQMPLILLKKNFDAGA